MTNDLQKASDTLLQSEQNKLIELVEVSEEFNESFCFFWGQPSGNIKVLRSNNRN